MAHGITGIDHALIGVRDLEAARMAYTRLGFTLSPRGRHIGWGTANYCVMFDEDYLELLGIVDPSQFSNNLDQFLAKREGGLGLAYATKDASASAASLADAGLTPGEARDLARQLELPEGTVLPRFKLLFPPASELPGLSSFICQHLTPELLSRPEWLAHANRIVGLQGVTVLVEDAADLVEPYERLFGPNAVNTTDDVLTVHAGRHRLVFGTAFDLEAMHPTVDLMDIVPSGIALITLVSGDLESTIDYLTTWQIEFEVIGRSVLIPAEAAAGAALEIVAG
ncbi:MAG TPA: VOC family protein [Stellaceae bacterium]|nr:VOC family protein [Stellaceae bacterium]